MVRFTLSPCPQQWWEEMLSRENSYTWPLPAVHASHIPLGYLPLSCRMLERSVLLFPIGSVYGNRVYKLSNCLLNLLTASASTISCDSKVRYFTTHCATMHCLSLVGKEPPTGSTECPLVPEQWDLVHGSSPSTLSTTSTICPLSQPSPFPNEGVPDFFSPSP